jgi:tRNA(Ile)-lysidine synthase
MRCLVGPDPARLRVCHFNHGLRGAESDADEAFVRAMAEGLGLPFESGRPQQPLETDEASLRAARYGWLGEVYRRSGACAIALGHHGDDLLESMLMGLFSGSGPAGMATPMPVKRFADGHVRIRPLLGLKREQIERSLQSLAIPWREDSSNADSAYTRNWVRMELLPQLRSRFPQDIFSGAQRTRTLMQESLDALDAVARALAIDISDPEVVDLNRLKDSEPAIARRLLMAWWLRHYPDLRLPADAADQLVPAICSGRETVVSIGRMADDSLQVLELTAGFLRLGDERKASPQPWPTAHWLPAAGPLFLPDGSLLSAGEQVLAGDQPYLDADPVREAWLAGTGAVLQVRGWQAGDRYRPLGAPGTRKLQDLFTDAKIPIEQRHQLPVILNDKNAILWVPGFPPAQAFKVCLNHKSALKLTYHGH